MSTLNTKTEQYVNELPQVVKQLESLRNGSSHRMPVEASFEDLVKEKYNLTYASYLAELGINPKTTTMENIFSMPNTNYRWVVPEILRNAIKLGLEESPFYTQLIAADQPVKALTTIMPFVNQSEATPDFIGEAETIPLGNISFGQKSVTLHKIGKGFRLTDEVRNYVSLDVLSMFTRDFGTQMGYALDHLLLQVLINGNQSDGSESAPVIGVKTVNSPVYRDILKIWVRGGLIGRNYSTMLGGEDMAIDLLDLPEFKDKKAGTTQANLNIKSPVPNSADFYIHGTINKDHVLLVDKRAAAVKLTAKGLSIESERVVSNQTSSIYATMTTGFSKMYQNATVILDKSKQFTTMPEIMNKDPFRNFTLG